MTELAEDTTLGRSMTFTNAYAAPEVIAERPRNSSTDIWSLGCVFLEMTVSENLPYNQMGR